MDVTDAPRRHSFFVHYVVVGLVGSIIVAIGSLGVGWLPVNTALYGNSVVSMGLAGKNVKVVATGLRCDPAGMARAA